MKYTQLNYLGKTICLTLLSLSVFLSLTAQVQTQVVGDSVHIHNNNGTAELILENNTKNVDGFLFNKGEGRTEFKKALLRIDDSTYVIGSDTLRLSKGLVFRNGLRNKLGVVEF